MKTIRLWYPYFDMLTFLDSLLSKVMEVSNCLKQCRKFSANSVSGFKISLLKLQGL